MEIDELTPEQATNLDTTVSGFATLRRKDGGADDPGSGRDHRLVGAHAALSRERGADRPARSAAGYRLYGPAELQRLRTLRELLAEHDLGLSDVAFAKRLREDPRSADTVGLARGPARAARRGARADWLRFEQDKHQRLLAAAAATN